jgi:hypothetical protein
MVAEEMLPVRGYEAEVEDRARRLFAAKLFFALSERKCVARYFQFLD